MTITLLGGPLPIFKRSIDAYRQSLKMKSYNPSDFPVATTGFFYAADDTKTALRELYPYVDQGMKLANGTGYHKRLFANGADMNDVMLVGSPQQIIEKMIYQYEELGHQRYLAQIDFGGMPFEKVMKNIEIIMKVVAISGAVIGKKTLTAMKYVAEKMNKDFPEVEFDLIDLSEKDIQFSDGRNYTEYQGDTLEVTTKIMEADALIIGTPIFQASIPGSVKNIFDLLPEKALRDKVVSIVVTAGSAKHYLVAEMQLKPILSYMKAQVLPETVFIEGQDLFRQEIINADINFRLDKLVEDTLIMVETFKELRKKQEDALF